MIPIPMMFLTTTPPIEPLIASYTFSSSIYALQGCDISYDDDYVYCMVDNDVGGISMLYAFDVTTAALSHTVSIPSKLKSLQMMSDGYFYGVTRGVASNSKFINCSATGSNFNTLYTNTGSGSSNIMRKMILSKYNNRIYTGSRITGQPANGNHIFSASASSSTLISSHNFIPNAHSDSDVLSLSSNGDLLLYLSSQDTIGIRVTKVTVPTHSVTSVTSNIIVTNHTEERSLSFAYDDSDTIMIAAHSSTYSQIIRYTPSSDTFTSSITNIGDDRLVYDITYASSNNSFYFIDRDSSTFTMSVSKTTDLVNFTTVHSQSLGYNSITSLKYIPSMNSVCAVYNTLVGNDIIIHINFLGL
jgi:hypothetical protein